MNAHPKPWLLGSLGLLAGSAASFPGSQLGEWPAEPEQSASNLTGLSKGFRKELSGAVWNPVTRTLWLCRNGPDPDGRLWVLEEDREDELGLRVALDGETRGEWRELGDTEGVTFAAFEDPIVFLLVEGEETIHEVDVTTYGEAVLLNVYDTRPYLPLEGSDGAEGLTFVPDEHLERAGFVDGTGAPRTSRLGLGGLMFVGHQNGGGIHAFDLNRATAEVEFVGEYRVLSDGEPLAGVAALEFDRSTGTLLAWHGLEDRNVLSLMQLASRPVEDEPFRAFTEVELHEGPGEANYEGLALVSMDDCGAEGRALFLTVDDGEEHSLLRYDHFRPGCGALVPVEPAEPAPPDPLEDPPPEEGCVRRSIGFAG